jgi:hypothetical protein
MPLPWRADVLCTRGATMVALEVQLVPTAAGEVRARQARYAAAGVRGDRLSVIIPSLFRLCRNPPAQPTRSP